MTLPKETLLDRFTRQDELLIEQIALLRSLAQRLGFTGGDGRTPPPVSQDVAHNLRVATMPLGLADTEVTWQLPIGLNTFTIQARNGNAVRFSSQKGVVALSNEPYFTLKAGVVYSQDDLEILLQTPATTLYFACSAANEVLELILGE